MRSVSIVIPAYNEENRLGSSLDEILRYASSRTWDFLEIVVVDDGSRDGTAALVERYAQKNPAIRLVRNPGNRGKGFAVRNGMLSAKGEWRLSTDADLSAPIPQLDLLLDEAIRQGAQVAIGSRALDRTLIEVHQPAMREHAGRVFNLVMRMITGLPFVDTQCGFKLFHADAAQRIFPRQQIDGFGFDVEDLFIAKQLGFKAIEVPVRWSNVEGTKVSLASGIKSFLDPVKVRLYQLQGKYR